MALSREYVEASVPTATDDDLACAFSWLLFRSEQELHLAAPRVQQLDLALTGLKAKFASAPPIVAIIDGLKKTRSVTLADERRLTAASLHPRCQARPNGACLLVWGDSKQANTVEQTLGPVGSICVLPWANHDLVGWVTANSVPKVNCDDPGSSALA